MYILWEKWFLKRLLVLIRLGFLGQFWSVLPIVWWESSWRLKDKTVEFTVGQGWGGEDFTETPVFSEVLMFSISHLPPLQRLKAVCLNLSDWGSPSTCTCSTGEPTSVSWTGPRILTGTEALSRAMAGVCWEGPLRARGPCGFTGEAHKHVLALWGSWPIIYAERWVFSYLFIFLLRCSQCRQQAVLAVDGAACELQLCSAHPYPEPLT